MKADEVISKFISPEYAIYAIHGGHIEPGTDKIAQSIAGEDLSLYICRPEQHVHSTLYNEPQALDLAQKVETIISIHGEHEENNSFVMVGGLDKENVIKIKDGLIEAEFTFKEPPEELDADNPQNICNRGKSNRGVQLEISRELRKELLEDNGLIAKFVGVIREAIL